MHKHKLLLPGLAPAINGMVTLFNAWRQRVLTAKLENQKQEAQERLNKLNEKIHKDRLAFEKQRSQAEIELQWANLDFQRQRLREEKELQREIAIYTRRSQLLIAEEQRKAALEVVEAQWKLDHWPLNLLPSDLLGRYQNAPTTPLKVFLVPPKLAYDNFPSTQHKMEDILTRMENALSIGLQKLLRDHYPIGSLVRPVEFIDGAWRSKRYAGRASIISVHKMLRAEPTLILELTDTDTTLHLRATYWGFASTDLPSDSLIAEIPLSCILQDSVEKGTKMLASAPELLSEQDSVEEKSQHTDHSSINQINAYPVRVNDIERAVRVTVNVLCLVTAWFADVHHLFYTENPEEVPPLLPRLFTDVIHEPYMGKILQPLLPEFVKTYHRLIEALKNEQPHCMSSLAMHLAEGSQPAPREVMGRVLDVLCYNDTFGATWHFWCIGKRAFWNISPVCGHAGCSHC